MKIGVLNERYNTLFNQFNGLYHEVAVKTGFSDAQYWILYALYITEQVCTQNELAAELCVPKQTIHSATSRLEKQGYLTLKQQKGPRNSKAVELTESGLALCERYVKPLIEAEERAIQRLPLQEVQAFLDCYENRLRVFREEIEPLWEEKDEQAK